MLQEHAKEIALKKHTFQQQVAAMKSGELKDLAKQTKVKHWQWASKDELTTLFTETDPTKVSAAQASIEAKHAKWAEKHLATPGKAAQPNSQADRATATLTASHIRVPEHIREEGIGVRRRRCGLGRAWQA